MFQVTNIVVILFFTTFINLVTTIIGWQRKEMKGGVYFVLGMLGITFWTLAAGFDYAAIPITLKVTFAKLEYVGYNTAFAFLALFVLSYTGYEDWLEKKLVMLFFAFVPISNILLAWTNDWHRFLWTGFENSSFGNNTVIFEHGPAYLWAVVTGYLMILIIILPLWQASRKGSEFSRRQARFLFLASLIPVIGNLAYLFEPEKYKGVDWSSITFSIAGLLFLVALYGTRLLDLVPIARDKLLNSMSDGMIVLDPQNRIIDINEAAAKIMGVPLETILGNDMADFAPHTTRAFWEQQVEQETRAELEVNSPDRRYFDALLSPLRDKTQKIMGRLIIFREITQRKRLEIEREYMIEELRKRNAESESLRETTVIVTSSLDVLETVQRILQQLKRVIAYDSASVWLYKGTAAYMVGSDGVPDLPEEARRYTVNEGDPDFPFWDQKPPYIMQVDIQENYAAFREPPINYIHGWLAVPLKVHDRLIGFISLDSKQADFFTHEDAKLAVNYANQVSLAIENARLFSKLQDELYERQKLINKLDARNSELESITYTVSHDLKAPLVTAKWFLDYLKDDIAAGNPLRIQTDINRINDSMDIMQKRVDGILDIARAGWMTDASDVIDFQKLVAEALELVYGRISQRNIKVTVDPHLPQVMGHYYRLLEAVQNLIDNAAKFMGDRTDPHIEIGRWGEEDGKAVFFIRDNGMGIPREQHDRIFGIFNKLNPRAEGTGIGLSLVKKIIEVHGGRLWVESETGKGSTFYFTLPRV